MEPREELIERIAQRLAKKRGMSEPWSSERAWAEAALAVVETATLTCPECENSGVVAVNFGIDSPGRPDVAPCPSHGRQPEPLLILEVLGGRIVRNRQEFWDAVLWRFPHRQEGA